MRFAALFEKELREGWRTGWGNIPAAALAALMLLAWSPSRAHLVLFLPLLSMPFLGATVLNRSIQTERLRGGLTPLLIYGGRRAEPWLAKVAAAFALAYLTVPLALAGYVFRFGAPAAGSIVHLLVTIPMAALGVIALEAALFWMLGRSSLLTVVLPLALLFSTAPLVARLGGGAPSAAGALVIAGGASVLVALLAMAIDRYPLERVTMPV